MKKITFCCTVALAGILLALASCKKNDIAIEKIPGISVTDYPKVDGSTSTSPLQQIIACRLLGMRYSWENNPMSGTWYVKANEKDDPNNFIQTKLIHYGTHESYVNLADKKSDMILVARPPSADELTYAGGKNVKFILSPVALDAFIFILNKQNPVNELTTNEIRDIYTGKITNWKDVGGADAAMHPIKRNANSGSQELMESLVMKGLSMNDYPIEMTGGMMGAFGIVRTDPNAVCYTVYYYKESMVRGDLVKHIAVDGVYPDRNTIKNRTYKYATEVYAVVRDDLDKNSTAYKLYGWLRSASGQQVVNESGYIGIK